MAIRSEVSGSRIDNTLLAEKVRLNSTVISSTGADVTLDADLPPLLILKLTAAANLKLPAAAAAIKGLAFTILNESTAANVATLVSSTGAALTVPQDKIAQYGAAKVLCSGADWYTIGATTA